MRILVVEDNEKTSAFLAKGLRDADFIVDLAKDGETAVEMACAGRYDLLIVDIMLPKKDGWTVLTDLRAAGINTPLMFLTARDSVADRVKGLELGAADYLVKPFAFSELIARAHSILRRVALTKQDKSLRLEDLEIDCQRCRAMRRGQTLNLTPGEFKLLHCLARAEGEVVPRQTVVEQVWGLRNGESYTNIVDVMMRRLRIKVDDPFEKKLIHTIRGSGYVLSSNGR